MVIEELFQRYDKIDSCFEWKAPRPMFRALAEKQKKLVKKEFVGVEIGTQRGTNAVNILKHLEIEKIYLVDPYEFYDYDGKTPNAVDADDVQDDNFKEAKRVLKKYFDKIEFVFKKSIDAVDSIPNKLDFVYIDGNHDYQFVKSDIEEYYPKLKISGYLGGHDINMQGVFDAVSEFRQEKKLDVNIKRKDWWFIK